MSTHRSVVLATLVLTVLVAVVTVFFTGQIIIPILILALAVTGIWQTIRAHRQPEAVGDVDRLNAMKYTDERDRAMAQLSFALVGISALALALITALVGVISMTEFAQPALIQLVILLAIWLAGNRYAARRV